MIDIAFIKDVVSDEKKISDNDTIPYELVMYLMPYNKSQIQSIFRKDAKNIQIQYPCSKCSKSFIWGSANPSKKSSEWAIGFICNLKYEKKPICSECVDEQKRINDEIKRAEEEKIAAEKINNTKKFVDGFLSVDENSLFLNKDLCDYVKDTDYRTMCSILKGWRGKINEEEIVLLCI